MKCYDFAENRKYLQYFTAESMWGAMRPLPVADKGAERVAAVGKIKEMPKPDDFFGYRNRTLTPTDLISDFLLISYDYIKTLPPDER